MKKEILEKIKKHDVCVLATCMNNKTEAATVDFAVDDNFIFYISTLKSYRKYKNLVKNKNVSIVVGFQMPCFQIDGKAEFLKPIEIELIMPFMIEKFPDAEDFFKMKEAVFLKIKPTYLKITDFVNGNYKITEIKF